MHYNIAKLGGGVVKQLALWLQSM